MLNLIFNTHVVTSFKIGYLLTSVTCLYCRLRCTTHRGVTWFFHSFLLTSYGIQVITGSENFTSKRHLLQVLTWLLALTILVTRTADRLDSTMDQELWMGPGQHATVVASNFC